MKDRGGAYVLTWARALMCPFDKEPYEVIAPGVSNLISTSFQPAAITKNNNLSTEVYITL